ncbi:hypothetical protein L6452_15581 [Arctium lappa]|uniref:Uncharacterized protein n=1 Tax=Arctium lappa TaxID=4217 RepID=A0ACB9CNZ3_ARCLA|nr:hypothetical protein L6452_15581 [Arctium lappa]
MRYSGGDDGEPSEQNYNLRLFGSDIKVMDLKSSSKSATVLKEMKRVMQRNFCIYTKKTPFSNFNNLRVHTPCPNLLAFTANSQIRKSELSVIHVHLPKKEITM